MVSHGAMIRLWTLTRAGNLDAATSGRWPLDNTGVVTLESGVPTGWYATRWQEEVVPHAAPAAPVTAAPGDGPGGEPLPV